MEWIRVFVLTSALLLFKLIVSQLEQRLLCSLGARGS